MKKIAIIHWLPLEYYPPITNLLDYLSKDKTAHYVAFSSNNKKGRKPYSNNVIQVIRYPFPIPEENVTIRMLKYIQFNIGVLLRLIMFKPDKILYFEPHSAGVVHWYCKYFKTNPTVLIHYHEYYEPSQFERRGMRLVKRYHQYERKFLYRKASWISQTNEKRAELFLRDCPEVDPNVMKVMPNYPPKSWQMLAKRQPTKTRPIKCVYLGSVALKDTYIREFCDWIINQQQGRIIFDIYSYNLPRDTVEYLNNLKEESIRLFDAGVPYHEIPEVLGRYHIGLVLHNGDTLNYVHNAPNKLFEYLSCGLDVWFPKEMRGIYPYERIDTLPKVIRTDFTKMNGFDLEKAVDKNGLIWRPCVHCYEDVLPELRRALLS